MQFPFSLFGNTQLTLLAPPHSVPALLMLHLLLCQDCHYDCCTMTGFPDRLRRQRRCFPLTQNTISICHILTNNKDMSCPYSRHWSLVGIRPRLAQASCTAAVHSRQLSWSLENHRLLYVRLLGCRRTLTDSLLARQRIT